MGIAIKGWLTDIRFNPEKMSTADIRKVIAAFEDGTCGWEELTKDALRERSARIQEMINDVSVVWPERKK